MNTLRLALFLRRLVDFVVKIFHVSITYIVSWKIVKDCRIRIVSQLRLSVLNSLEVIFAHFPCFLTHAYALTAHR